MFNRAYVEITDVCNLACSFCPGTTKVAVWEYSHAATSLYRKE